MTVRIIAFVTHEPGRRMSNSLFEPKHQEVEKVNSRGHLDPDLEINVILRDGN